MPVSFRSSGLRFDVISAVSVIEHIPDPLPFVRSYAQLLKSHGVMVIIIPQFTGLNAAVSRAASANAAPPFHVSLFQRSNLRLLLDRVALFQAVQTSQFGPPAFSLLHHYDTSQYWDASIPSRQEPVPKSIMVREYPVDIARAINALGEVDALVASHFADLDGRLYVMAIARQRPARASGVIDEDRATFALLD